MNARDRARLDELLAERATQGLDGVATEELRALLAASAQGDDEGFDLAAAAIELALLVDLEEMPARVRDRLVLRGRAWARSMPGRDQ